MFVQNTMVHDARVRKEARTLTEAGYGVTVVCLLDPARTPREEIVHGFRILRISPDIISRARRPAGPLAEFTLSAANGLGADSGRPALHRRGALARADRVARLARYPLRRALAFLRFVRAGVHARADVYHAHDLNTLLIAWTASRLRRKPLVYDSHEIETDRAGLKMRWWACFLERALIGRADRVICTNQTRADYTQRRYGIVPPTILRNLPAYVEPPPSKLMHERLGLPPDTRIVLYQGGVQRERGLEELLAAAPDIRGGVIVILGSGRLKPFLQQRVRELGLESRVLFHEAVPVEELPAWTAGAYLGLQVLQNTCFNHYSSLSNKLLEYLMAGVPVIANDLPEMRRVIEDTGAGLIIVASDPHKIAEAVNLLLGDERLRQEMSEKAVRARCRYCWEVEEHVLVDLYAGLLAPSVTG